MFDWDDLRHFAALAEAGTLSGAARRLGVEHATVARRIAALEAAVGARLVDRRAGRIRLTEAGERVAAHARTIGDEALALERAIVGARTGLDAELVVTGPQLLFSALVVPRLSALMVEHPDLRLTLIAEIRTLSLQQREADLALRLSRPADATLMVRRVGRMRYGLYAAPGYAARPPEAWRFIDFDDSLAGAPHQLWLTAMAAGRPVVLRSNNLGVQRAAAAAGAGVVSLPLFAAEGLERVAPAESFDRDIWLTYHRDLRDSPAVAVVAACLAEAARAA
ncbi:MAG: LysR family transcriptional regulator [Amaricoccus sp.]|uniref:LysR family transcriptional regulator n=1 Tax=Amaricoccus sp. TaxID=1872485 RepID=UPI0039E38CBA